MKWCNFYVEPPICPFIYMQIKVWLGFYILSAVMSFRDRDMDDMLNNELHIISDQIVCEQVRPAIVFLHAHTWITANGSSFVSTSVTVIDVKKSKCLDNLEMKIQCNVRCNAQIFKALKCLNIFLYFTLPDLLNSH